MLNLKYLSLIFCSFYIFIISLTKLRSLLENKANYKLKKYISKCTNNYHISFFLGIFITIILTSSTALTIITISFLSSNLIKEKSAFALILGANIGTSLTAFLFSFEINSISFVFIIIGLILKLLKKEFLGNFLITLGIIFFSLVIIEIAVNYFSSSISIIFSNSLFLTLLEGIFIAIFFNSSSTAIITSQMLFNSSSISLLQGIAIMLGANIGTTITSYFFTINQSRSVKKIIIYNIIFNLFGAMFFLIFIDYFVFLLSMFNLLSFNKQIISISHFIFNLLSTFIIYLFFIPITKPFNQIANLKIHKC